MVLTKKQEEGLRVSIERYKANEPYTCIAGFAGSGKSTLIKFIIAALDVDPEDVCYVAYTGKAATVLQQKGCPNATTAHKLLYRAKPTPDGKFIFEEKKFIDYKVIVVDEISMLPKSMWDRLLKHNKYILACGDPGQLPPVSSDDDNHVLDNPHIFLDEIMRQAQDSEIIRLSMWVREGKSISDFPCSNKQVQIFSPNQAVSGMYSWADQILCATNIKRNEINNYVRQQKGYGPSPTIGDKIISLHNHWDWVSVTGAWALTNGSIGTIVGMTNKRIWLPRYISQEPINYMFTSMILEDDDIFCNIPIDYKCLTTGEASLTSRQIYQLRKNKNFEFEPPFDFAYAYAITTHKSQGSEWDKVLVFEENFPRATEEHKRWLYTAITRAKEKVVIVKKN